MAVFGGSSISEMGRFATAEFFETLASTMARFPHRRRLSKVHEGALLDGLFDEVENVIRLTDGDVDAEHAKEIFVLRIVDTSDRAANVKFSSCYLRDDEIVFVLARDRRSPRRPARLRGVRWLLRPRRPRHHRAEALR